MQQVISIKFGLNKENAMTYNTELGLFGNITKALREITNTNNTVSRNEQTATDAKNETDDGLLDIASITSDDTDASAELGEMVAELYEAVTELADLMAERN